ncbi:hypothetical protein E2C01_055874 [Portunus trituberculatus]|uniref:Uncharacterized protein n=1 Tax=Portunus trituberculatus TaxID=210409 RepID=A0A5B7GXA7_PORTR|nr:hypothetical protein [Portunus trituberculatus]
MPAIGVPPSVGLTFTCHPPDPSPPVLRRVIDETLQTRDLAAPVIRGLTLTPFTSLDSTRPLNLRGNIFQANSGRRQPGDELTRGLLQLLRPGKGEKENRRKWVKG